MSKTERPFQVAKSPFVGAQQHGDLEQRIARLEDEAAINRVMVAYTSYCDPYDAVGFASLFTEDGVWESGHYGAYRGRAAIEAFIDGVKNEIVWAAHHITNADITVSDDGQSAVGIWYLLVFETIAESDGKRVGYLAMADYHVKFLKVDGVWFIEEIKPKTKSETAMDREWGI